MGKVVRAVVGATIAVIGIVTGNPALIVQGAAMTFSAVTEKTPKPTANQASQQRLSKSLIPETPRKIVLGRTALPTDIRFWETYGTNNTSYVEVLAAAGHKMTSYGRLWIDDAEVTFSGENAVGTYAGSLKRYTTLVGVSGAGRALGSGTRWTAASSMTGCSWYALDWAWTQQKLPNGIPSRYTQEGEGSPVYDPRRDVSFGGTHVITDQSTWEYSPLDSNGEPIGRNNALQMLRYLLGWRVQSPQTGEWHRVDGRGVAPADINLASFIEAANNCELEGWYSDCVLSTGDSHGTNEGILEAASGGKLVDTGGRWSYWVATDDTASIAVTLGPDDFEGDAFEWVPRRPISEQFNEIAGTFVDPNALYQPRPFPMVFDPAYYAEDGYKRRAGLVALSAVQDPEQAQRLMRIRLNKSRRQGVFRATFKWKALKAENFNCVRVTFPPLGFSNKLFRIIEMGLSDAGVDLTLEEEDGAVYLGGTILPYTPPSAGEGYDRTQLIPVANMFVSPTGVYGGGSGADATARDGLLVYWDAPPPNARRTELRYRQGTTGPWTPVAPVLPDQTQVIIEPLQPVTSYQVQVRHVSINEVPGNWFQATQTTDSVTVDPVTGTLRYADGTPIDNLRPSQIGADVTLINVAGGIVGQGPGATAPGSNVLNQFLNGSFFNRLAMTNFDSGTRGWNKVLDFTGGAVLARGVNGNIPFLSLSANTSAADQVVSLSSTQSVYRAFCRPGERMAVSALVGSAGPVSRMSFGVLFWDAAGNYIDTGTSYQYRPDIFGPISYPTLVSGFVRAPAGAVTCTLEHYQYSSGPGAMVQYLAQPMISPANESQTIIPTYAPGFAGVPGADPTGENVAAAIINQGWGATASELQAANARLGLGVNAVVNSNFERGLFGWGELGIAATRGYNLAGFSGVNNVAYVTIAGALGVGVNLAAFRNHPVASYTTDIKTYGLPVTGGDRVFASTYIARHRCNAELVVAFWNDASGFVTSTFAGGRLDGGANGDLANFDRVGGFVTVPAGYTRATIFVRARGTGESNPYLFFTCSMICRVPASQVTWPEYHNGPLNPPTSVNEAAGGGVVLSPTAPLSPGPDPSFQINIAAATVTFSAGQTYSMPSATLSGMSANTTYAVFRDLQTASYLAVSTGMTQYFVSLGRYLFLGYITTAINAGGSYSPPPTQDPWIGGGYGRDNQLYMEP